MPRRKVCDVCDRNIATLVDDARCPGGCTCVLCMSLCWRKWNAGGACGNDPVDWRTRALEAEAKLREIEQRKESAEK